MWVIDEGGRRVFHGGDTQVHAGDPDSLGNSGPGYSEVPDAIGAFVKAAKAAGLAHTVLAPGASLD